MRLYRGRLCINHGRWGLDRLSEDTLNQVLERFRSKGESLGACLAAFGWDDEAEGLRAFAKTLGIQFVDLSSMELDRTAASGIPPELIHKTGVIPVSRENGGALGDSDVQ
jgi:hypothetical protein